MTKHVAQAGDIIQIAPHHKWAGCLAVVNELKTYGVQAYVAIPSTSGQPTGLAYINLAKGDYETVGAAPLWLMDVAPDVV